jgi:ATP-binding cassette, subfamily B, bacterial HlyB/CyaB
LQQTAIAVRRLGDIMDAPAEPYAVLPRHVVAAQASIEAIDLGFRYGDRNPFLHRNLSFKVESGQCVAIIGGSGTGKSTLARLLLGFYLPSEGRILVAGRDTQSVPANELRQYFGVVPQETMLFSGTIYENLAIANPHASFAKIVQACRMADIHGTIERLGDGYQTVIGEHGVGLSGGQKQRLAIARALLKNPQVLVFDEATSHLDSETAEHVAKTIERLRGRVTVLFIAHDLPNGLTVDQVVTLGRGAAR